MKLDSNHRILIFDSGIGGLSISDEIRALTPQVSIVYVADNRIYPYGKLSEQALIERIIQLLPALIERFEPEAIVIACNSASTLVLDHLREQTHTPVIGVVPAIKPAAEQSTSQTIGLLATPGTVTRAYTDRLVHDFAPHCQVIRVGSHELVDEAEKKLRGRKVNAGILEKVLRPITENADIDQVVLGCTHFPFLRNELGAILGAQVLLVDSGQAIARRTKYILNSLQDKPSKHALADHFIFTKDNNEAHQLVPHLGKHGFEQVEFIER